LILAILAGSYLMIVVDVSIVLTGLPHIQADLGFSQASLSWVQNAYTLSFGGFLLPGARAGDILGQRRMFMAGLGMFTLSSLGIALAPEPGVLLAFRGIQGLSAALLAPASLALIASHFAEGPARTRALAWHSAIAGIGATLGLVLGGLLADLISWRAGFLINLPLGLLLMAGTHRFIRSTPPRPGRFDPLGALNATLGMGALVFGIVEAAETGWNTSSGSALLAGASLLAFFLHREQRNPHPTLPLHLLNDPARNGAYLARMLFLAGMVGFWFFTAQYLQGVLGLSPLAAGLAFIPVTLPNFITALALPRLSLRWGQRRVLLGGLGLGCGGLLLQGLAAPHPEYGFGLGIALPMVLIGLAQGCILGPLTQAGVAGVRPEDTGAASGLVNVAHQLGASLGLALLVVVFASASHGSTAQRIGTSLEGAAFFLALALGVAARYVLRPGSVPHPTRQQAA
jgi:EmrB/QacA subfamily drug resistance transporter